MLGVVPSPKASQTVIGPSPLTEAEVSLSVGGFAVIAVVTLEE